MAFTTPKTWAFQEGVESAELNTHLRDNFLAMGPHLIVRKPSDETVSASTTPHPDGHLVLPLAANEVWQFGFGLIIGGDVTADVRVGFTFPSGTIAANSAAVNAADTTTTHFWSGSSPAGYNFLGLAASDRYYSIVGVMSNGGTPGSLVLSWAQAVASGTTTIRANSTLWAVKLA